MNGTTSMMIAQAASLAESSGRAAEDVHRRAHPEDEEDRDCGDEEDPDHVLPLTLSRRPYTRRDGRLRARRARAAADPRAGRRRSDDRTGRRARQGARALARAGRGGAPAGADRRGDRARRVARAGAARNPRRPRGGRARGARRRSHDGCAPAGGGHGRRLAARARLGGDAAPVGARGRDRPRLEAARRGDRPRCRRGRLGRARQRVAAAPQAARGAAQRPPPRDRQARAARPLERLARASAGGLRDAARRPAGARRQGELAKERAGDRPRRLRLRPHALRRAVRGRGADDRLSEATGAERDEVERILRELSATVGEQAEALRAAVEATAAIDLARTRDGLARLARHSHEQADEVRLAGARHPLLDPATAVPIDLELGPLRRS